MTSRARGATIERVTLVGDREREQATLTLRRHFVAGRLDDSELSDRLDLVLHARSRSEISYALRRLPRFDELPARVRHGLVVVLAVGLWLMLTAAMFVAFVTWTIVNGATLGALLAFPAIWLALTGGLYWKTRTSGRRPLS
jgi:uncharacterized protein DUF1707